MKIHDASVQVRVSTRHKYTSSLSRLEVPAGKTREVVSYNAYALRTYLRRLKWMSFLC